MTKDLEESRFLGKIIFTENQILSLSKIRIIKKNLVHAHGFPTSLSNSEKLGKVEYFGQYGKIQKILLTSKTNSETNKKTFSAYITYSNEKEASFAILAVDSLLIEGKLIRAFFGTTKYCNYFLNNFSCPNEAKCMFLHKLVNDKDIIIDSNTVFSYNEHLNLAKKIIGYTNIGVKKKILKIPKPKNTIFPNINFIFLNEDEKEKYLFPGNISYFKSVSNPQALSYNNYNDIYFNFQNNFINSFNNNINNFQQPLIKNKSTGSLDKNNIYNHEPINAFNDSRIKENCSQIINPNEPIAMHKLFKNSIKQILLIRPLFPKINNNKFLKKMEFYYFKNELIRKNINIYNFLNGCLDCIQNLDTIKNDNSQII